MSRWRVLMSSVAVFAVALPSFAWSCAVCWGGDEALSRGLNASVLFMMSMPFLVGGSILGVFYVAHQRARGQKWLYVSLQQVQTWFRKEDQA
jgi:hypothetical protein